jgi:hypothetical protein
MTRNKLAAKPSRNDLRKYLYVYSDKMHLVETELD